MTKGLRCACAILMWLACIPIAAAADTIDTYATEVYRDQNAVVSAGISGSGGQIVHLGDVLSLVVTVSWNRENVNLEEPDERFFTDAWPEDGPVVLLKTIVARRTDGGEFSNELQTVFRFQITGCPGEELTCPGDREYLLPTFTLNYRTDTAEEPVAVQFRPQPERVTAMTTIPRDDEGQLYSFLNYFPTGAYPNPVTVLAQTNAPLIAFGIASTSFFGAMLMWSFFYRRKNSLAVKEAPRWQSLLHSLPDEEGENTGRLADDLRRCLVWYCSDELNVDTFDWLSPSGPGQQEPAHPELRMLFLDMLQNPAEQTEHLRSRLTTLLADGRQR